MGGCLLIEQTGEVHRGLLGTIGGSMYLDEVCPTDDVLQSLNTYLCKVFTYLLSKESEEVYNILSTPPEVCTQSLVLSSHAHRTGVSVTLTHHDTAENYERQCAK